tara:strand:+ start:5751 stop:6248 length:498 start_codon:yes stop_codon:yes gene_type:complete
MNCCNKSKGTCTRKDNKKFSLPRKFSKHKCLTKKISGFTMKASCAPYKFCKKGGNKRTKKKILYNPKNPKKSFDVYIDKNPNDTIPIKYKTLNDVKNTIKKLERLYKSDKYTHKRIWQVGMIMYVRLKKLKDKKSKQFKLSQKYFKFLGKRTKLKNKNTRKKLKF